jgi:DNA-binding CsgD family transcriptional regulator
MTISTRGSIRMACDTAAGAREALGNESGTELDGGGVAPQPMPPKLSRRLRNDMDDETIDAPLNRLSSREREILAMLANGWSNRRIAEACYLSLNTVRTHVENIQVKLGVHTKLEAVAVALEHGWPPAADASEELAIDRLGGSRVMAAMRELPSDQREVLQLRMAGGLTAPEAAELLGETTGAVKALQHRGLARVLGLQSTAQTSEHPLAAPDPDHQPRQEKPQG